MVALMFSLYINRSSYIETASRSRTSPFDSRGWQILLTLRGLTPQEGSMSPRAVSVHEATKKPKA